MDEIPSAAARGMNAALCACVAEFAIRVGPDPEPAIRDALRRLSEALAADGATWEPDGPRPPLELWVFSGDAVTAVNGEDAAARDAGPPRVGLQRVEAGVPQGERTAAVLTLFRRNGREGLGRTEVEAVRQVARLFGRLMDVHGGWARGRSRLPRPRRPHDGQQLVSDLFALSVELLSRPDPDASLTDLANAITRLDQATYRLRRTMAGSGAGAPSVATDTPSGPGISSGR